MGAAGSFLWNDFVAALGTYPLDNQGRASTTLAIPALGALVGQSFTFQWWTMLPGINALGIGTSDGLRVTIGQ